MASHTEVAQLMAELYFDEPAARSVLLRIGMPPNLIAKFTTPDEFWATIVFQLDQGLGIPDGIAALLEATVITYPGNKKAKALHTKYVGQPPEPHRVPDIGIEGACPTLTLFGADLPDEFLATIREQLRSDKPELLYVSKETCAVQIPDLGDQAAQLREQIEELVQTHLPPGTEISVVYDKFNFQPYLYSELTVFGPDTTPYLLQSVPSTMTPADIAAAIVQQIPAMSGREDATISTVIDLETDAGSERLNPELTLHENKVRDKGKLRVGTKAVAGGGMISPELRMEAQLRMRAQIRRYELGHRDFEIVGYDNEDLPNKITFELSGPGFAPPEDLDQFLEGTANLDVEQYKSLPWDQLRPLPIEFHRFTLYLSAGFPVAPPFVVWETPIFHPNVWRVQQIGTRAGTVCLGPLMDGWRPDLDFGWLCQLIVDIATYQNYDVTDATTYPDPPAALWARTEAGQRMIQSIGGPPMRVVEGMQPAGRVGRSLWLSPLTARQAGSDR